jgi:hypothetical protein
MYTIGQMNQLADALEKAGFSPADVTRLRSPEILAKLKQALDGKMTFLKVKHVIDCDQCPELPDGWEVDEHQPGGQFEWDLSRIELYLCDEQKRDSIKGKDLRKKLKNMPNLNANVLDYLLEHTELIPDTWKGKYIFFWGTIYYGTIKHNPEHRNLCVRCLFWKGAKWSWSFEWLDSDLSAGGRNPAILCK